MLQKQKSSPAFNTNRESFVPRFLQKTRSRLPTEEPNTERDQSFSGPSSEVKRTNLTKKPSQSLKNKKKSLQPQKGKRKRDDSTSSSSESRSASKNQSSKSSSSQSENDRKKKASKNKTEKKQQELSSKLKSNLKRKQSSESSDLSHQDKKKDQRLNQDRRKEPIRKEPFFITPKSHYRQNPYKTTEADTSDSLIAEHRRKNDHNISRLEKSNPARIRRKPSISSIVRNEPQTTKHGKPHYATYIPDELEIDLKDDLRRSKSQHRVQVPEPNSLKKQKALHDTLKEASENISWLRAYLKSKKNKKQLDLKAKSPDEQPIQFKTDKKQRDDKNRADLQSNAFQKDSEKPKPQNQTRTTDQKQAENQGTPKRDAAKSSERYRELTSEYEDGALVMNSLRKAANGLDSSQKNPNKNHTKKHHIEPTKTAGQAGQNLPLIKLKDKPQEKKSQQQNLSSNEY